MIELRGINDLEEQRLIIKRLPIEVQEQIKQTLTALDESYEEVGERTFEGGKVVVVKEQEDAEQVSTLYDLANNEFVDEVHTSEGTFVIALVIFGSENSIMIIGKREILESYL